MHISNLKILYLACVLLLIPAFSADKKSAKPAEGDQTTIRAEVEMDNVVIYWDKSSAELSIDPISRVYDFEGYRIYRSNPGADFTDPANLLLNLDEVVTKN